MAIACFLAMTAAEIRRISRISDKIAWMACHFSPFSPGLSNLPRALPPDSLLMVDDITPIRKHDPGLILDQLCTCAEMLSCSGILLDFQRPGVKETAALVKFLSEGLSCPVAASHHYADVCSCAVCLPPVPPSASPETHFSPWKGRELWLEISTEAQIITVTEEGISTQSQPPAEPLETDFFDETLLCHYRCRIHDDAVRFTLHRTKQDLTQLLSASKKYGVTTAVGLYQEMYRRDSIPRLPCVKEAD